MGQFHEFYTVNYEKVTSQKYFTLQLCGRCVILIYWLGLKPFYGMNSINQYV